MNIVCIIPSRLASTRLLRKAPLYHHVGVYAFRRDFLLQYTKLPQTPLEKIESLEQLRVLEHGYKIRVCLTEGNTLEINTPKEYKEAQLRMLENV